jgi:hypothetical protein
MSRPFPRVAFGTVDQSKGRNLPARDTSSRVFVNLPTSPLPDQDPLDTLGLMNLQRPAIPRPELKQVTQITQQIKAIESITTFTASERLAIISDVASCLPALHKLLKGNKVSRALAAKARKLIALLNAATVVEKDTLEQTLHFLSRARLPEGLTREDFVDCVDTLDKFIFLVRPFAKEVGLHDSWQAVVVSVLQQYFRLLPDTGTGETPVDESPHSWDSWIANETYQPMTPPNTTETAHSPVNALFVLPCMEELPQIDDSLDQETALEMLQSIMIYLTQWNHLDPRLYRENATTFSPNLASIVDTLETIDSVNNRILSSELVQECLAACLEVWTSFAQIWGTAVEDALAERLWLLAEQARAYPKQVPEAVFSHVMDDIRALSRHLLLETPTALSNHEEGGIIQSKFALRARQFCKLLHHNWQGQAYESELHQLWLLIWRSLRVLYKVKEKSGVFQRAEKGFIDAAFFDKPGVSATFARLLKTSDAANPRSVEDMVAQYCRLIATCRSDPDDRYDHLRHYKETELRAHVITSLERFIETRQAKDNLLQKLHRAVVRFNFITKGPATVRRWGTDGAEQDWAIELLDLVSPTKALAPGPNSPTFLRPEGETPMNDHFPNPSPTTLPHPMGINIKSAFDYVYYPLPETRAHEVAQSALISRDLQDPGTVSHELRIEDLVNIPPRHVRGPSNLSPFKWPAYVTPGEVITAVRNRFSQVRSGLWRSIGRTPSKQPHQLESTFYANRHRATALNRDRVSKHASAKRSVRLRGGAGSQHASSGSQHAQAGSQEASGDQMQNQNQNPPSQAFQNQHIQEFRAKAECGEDFEAVLIILYLERTSWDIANAVKQFKAVQQFEKESLFGELGVEFWRTEIAYLERNNWDVESALADFATQMAAFKGTLEIYERIPDIEIAKYFAAGITQSDNAMEFYRTDLARIVSCFKGAIVSGDTISREAIIEIYRQHGNNLEEAVESHLERRRIGAPCYKCPEVPGSTHHHCECPSHSPDFLETEARKDRSKFRDPTTCHACPYFPGEYHHPKTPPPDWPTYLQRPERCKHKDDNRHVFDAFTPDEFRDLLNTLDAAPDSMFPFLLGPNGFGVPRLDDRLWRRNISSAIADLTNTTRELRAILVTAFSRVEPLPMDEVENFITRRPDTAQTSTVELCRRAAIDLKAYFDRISDIVAGPWRRYAMLGFRHAFGRFIRTLNELRSLYLDLVLCNDFDEQDVPGLHWDRIDHPPPGRRDEQGSDVSEDGNQANHPGGGNHIRRDDEDDDEVDTSDSEDVHSLSGDEAPQIRSQSPQGEIATPVATNVRPRRLPTYEDYNNMYMDELELELLAERKVNPKVVGQYPRKHDRIQLLMRLDNRGVYGEGARNGYFAITGNARGRPANWLEDSRALIQELMRSRRDKFNVAQIQRRKQRRIANRRRRRRNAEREERRRETRQENQHESAVDLADISDDSDASADTDDGILHSASTARSTPKSISPRYISVSPDRTLIGSQKSVSTQRSTPRSDPQQNDNEQVGDQQHQAKGGVGEDDAAEEHTSTRTPTAPGMPLRKQLKVIPDPPA